MVITTPSPLSVTLSLAPGRPPAPVQPVHVEESCQLAVVVLMASEHWPLAAQEEVGVKVVTTATKTTNAATMVEGEKEEGKMAVVVRHILR
jgi:hypothetical protein